MSEHYLFFSAMINPQSHSDFMTYLVDLSVDGATKLTIALNSPGGGVSAGVAIHNTMLSMPYEIVTHNIGNADSIANIMFLAGAKRYASPSATFMFHGVGFDGDANERLEEKNLKEKLDIVEADNKRIASIIEARCGIPLVEGIKLFEAQSTKDAIWAKSNRIIHDIAEFKLPTGVSVKYLV